MGRTREGRRVVTLSTLNVSFKILNIMTNNLDHPLNTSPAPMVIMPPPGGGRTRVTARTSDLAAKLHSGENCNDKTEAPARAAVRHSQASL